jgi:hypothetical protein
MSGSLFIWKIQTMRICSLILLLLANLASAQNASPGINPDTPVITLHGYCDHTVKPDEDCKTVVTRAQFEQLSTALQPDMTMPQLLKVANAYARNLRMAALAEQRGIDKTEAFQEQMRYARLQLLAQDLDQTLQTEARQISDADVDLSFHAHQSDFEQATLVRIFVPHIGKSATATAEAMAQLAASVRYRLENGEDADRLQREVFEQAAMPVNSVNTRLDKIRRDALAPNHAAVMALQTNQVSEVISDPEGAHFIYKLLEKRDPALAEVRDEIVKTIATQRYRDSTKATQGQTVFSDAYFNPATPGERHARTHKNASE